MNSFRTEIFPEKSNFSIGYHQKTVFIGSCFTENIGNKFIENKFPVLVNPFGVLYNPLSVQKAIGLIIKQKKFKDEDLQFANDKWFSFEHHGSFSGTDKELVLKNINKQIDESHRFLKNTDALFVTFGTSWYYQLKTNQKVVANCHKLPANRFSCKLLSVEEIVAAWTELIGQLKKFNPEIKLIFTISPIRHWKDGAVNNQLSKSILNVAIHRLIEKFEQTSYFPAYELVMDDLRDYRFYADDFLHPNTQAINYIWDKFSAAFIEDKNLQIAKKINRITKAVSHRPLHPKTETYRKFLQANIEKIKQLGKDYPFIDFSKEKEYFEGELRKWFVG
jgi:hypothetical protein